MGGGGGGVGRISAAAQTFSPFDVMGGVSRSIARDFYEDMTSFHFYFHTLHNIVPLAHRRQ